MRDAVVVPIQQRALGEYRRRANELLLMSESILEAAKLGDWGLALTRQRQRSSEMASFFAVGESNISQEVAELIASCIRQMLATDAQVTDLAYSGRETLEREAGLAKQQGRAAKAYLGQSTP